MFSSAATPDTNNATTHFKVGPVGDPAYKGNKPDSHRPGVLADEQTSIVDTRLAESLSLVRHLAQE